MTIILCLCFSVIFFWTHVALSKPLALHEQDISNNPAPGLIPNEFNLYRAIAWGTLFTEDAGFINVVQALSELASGDFNGETQIYQFKTDVYPHPVITLTSQLHIPIKRKFVIWGLVWAFLEWQRRGLYMCGQYIFQWNGQEVGGMLVGYEPTDARGLHGGINDTVISKSAVGRASLTDQVSAGPSIASVPFSPRTRFSKYQLSLLFTYLGEPLNKRDMFRSTLFTLAQTARPPADAEVVGIWRPTYQSQGCVFAVAVSTSPAAPPLPYFDIIEAVASSARYIVSRNIYRSLRIEMKVGNQRVGTAAFMRTPPLRATGERLE
ncbi:MAG: hypothetical protein Q9219_005377 [cf. Caloplaca sp. 3 TL-2023]